MLHRKKPPSGPRTAAPTGALDTKDPANNPGTSETHAEAGLKASLLAICGGFVSLIAVSLSGWLVLGGSGLRKLRSRAAEVNLVPASFLAACVATILATMPAWVHYTVQFQKVGEYGAGSSARILFLTPPLCGIILFALRPGRALAIFYSIATIVILVYGAGLIFPNPVHTQILLRQDYRLGAWTFAYPVCLLLSVFLGPKGLSTPLLRSNEP